ncbi:cutinase 1 [Apiospora rasikravindrae]|uniref:Cutinase n=1 Tax=Apiospora rasikravindrae TaxID=990691 RepID=A0ABR1SPP5_9PEZI
MRTLLPVLAVISAAWAQTWTTGWDSKEFLQYGCRPIMLFFAKATFEPGNMGNTVGPQLSNSLKAAFGVTNLATEGIDYWGLPIGNFNPGGAPPWAVTEMARLLAAAAACPKSRIIISGYSQGAAITHRAVQTAAASLGFPTNKTLIICNLGDVICTGTLLVYPVHLDYIKWVPTAVAYLIEKLLEADARDPFMGLMGGDLATPPALPEPSAWPSAWTSLVAPMPTPSNG